MVSDALRACQTKITSIEESYNAQSRELKKEYRKKTSELYKKRGEIIRRSQPDLWCNVLLAHQDLEELLGPYDGDILSDLVDFEVEEDPEDASFKIILTLGGKNEYIQSTVLWKSFDSVGNPTGRSGVQWKKGQVPLLPSEEATHNAKKDVASKREREERFPTFFTFFMEDREAEIEADIATCLKQECFENPDEVLIDDDGEEEEEGEEDEGEEGEEEGDAQ